MEYVGLLGFVPLILIGLAVITQPDNFTEYWQRSLALLAIMACCALLVLGASVGVDTVARLAGNN